MSMLMLVVQGASAILETLNGYLFLGILSDKCREKFLRRKIYLGIWTVFLGIQIFINKRIVFFSNLWFLTIILFMWISVIIIVREEKVVHLLLICIFNCILALLDFLGAFGVIWYIGNTKLYKEFLYYTTDMKIVIILFIRIILTLFLIGAEIFIRKNHIEIQLETHKLLVMALVGVGGILFFQKIFVDEHLVMSVSVWFIILCIVMILIILSMLALAYLKAKQKEQMISIRNELLEHNYTEMYELYRLNAEQFHDFKNHLNIIYEYCREERWDKVTEYVYGIREPMASLDRRIWSGNDVIDLILNYKKSEAVNAGIKCEIETDKIDLGHIVDQDLCTVLSNVIDNSIEACKKVTLGKPWIKVIIRSKGNILVVKVTNSLGIKPVEKNGKLLTIKEKKGLHGLGLASVNAVVEKYEGVMKYRYDDKEFEISITMYD